MEWCAFAIASLGWSIAILQIIIKFKEDKRKSEVENLDKILEFFLKGTQGRSIGISLIQETLLKNKKSIEIILPVIVSQSVFLINDVEKFEQDTRNLIRMLQLIEKCIPYSSNSYDEVMEVINAFDTRIMDKDSKGVDIGRMTMESWRLTLLNKLKR